MAALALLSMAPGCEREQAGVVIEREPGVPIAPRHARQAGKQGENAHAQARPAPAASKPFARVSGPGYEGYVRPAYSAEHWEPVPDDIAALEQRVPAAVAGAVERGELPALDREISAYARQYYGYIKDGNKMIEVRFFCDRHLAARDVHISGGGGCYFKAVYDTRTGVFLGFK